VQRVPYRFATIAFDDAPVAGRAVDVFLPPGQPRPVAVFMVHGGGWRQGGRAQYHALMSALRVQGYIAASTDYRLEGATIQDQLHDVRLGYRLFRQELAALGPVPPVVAYGGSAGGHLAALLALAAPGACGEDVEGIAPEWVRPAGAILVSAPATFEPWDDIFPGIWASMQVVVGRSWSGDPDAYRRVSPIRHVGVSPPPVLLLDGGNEHMFPRELGQAFVARLRAAGGWAERHEFPAGEHGFLYDVVRRPQREAFDHVLRFLASLPGA
jgi:acetyl esterase/lipase